MRILLLQDLDSRTLLAGMTVDTELSEKEKKDLVKNGKAAEVKGKVKRDKKSFKKP